MLALWGLRLGRAGIRRRALFLEKVSLGVCVCVCYYLRVCLFGFSGFWVVPLVREEGRKTES